MALFEVSLQILHHSTGGGRPSERITDGKMIGHSVAETFEVVESAALRSVGGMESDADIKAKDEEVEVVPDAGSRAESNAPEVAGRNFSIRTLGVALHKPHIASIEKEGAVQSAEEVGTEFHVGLKLKVAGLVDIRILRVRGTVASGACRPHRKGPDRVGTTNIELLGIRSGLVVTVIVNDTCKGTAGKLEPLVEGEGVMYLGSGLHELRKTAAEKVGRNDPCPCGSGKKYKKCCGAGLPDIESDDKE